VFHELRAGCQVERVEAATMGPSFMEVDWEAEESGWLRARKAAAGVAAGNAQPGRGLDTQGREGGSGGLAFSQTGFRRSLGRWVSGRLERRWR